jgi:glycosyltransferase involved in cell wall biosynthesis
MKNMEDERSISCVIPAYNEAPRIGAVLSAAVGHPLLKEIIVVDDGSEDGTGALVVRDFPSVRLITHPRNRGKSAAVASGIRESSGKFIMMLDADLVGLRAQDITDLAMPILRDQADTTFSLRKNAGFLAPLLGVSFITGERVFKTSLVSEHLRTMEELPGYGLEVFLNRLVIDGYLRLSVVPWRNVSFVRKTEKDGYFEGSMRELAMIKEMRETVSLMEMMEQNFLLLERMKQTGARAIMR